MKIKKCQLRTKTTQKYTNLIFDNISWEDFREITNASNPPALHCRHFCIPFWEFDINDVTDIAGTSISTDEYEVVDVVLLTQVRNSVGFDLTPRLVLSFVFLYQADGTAGWLVL